MSEVDKWVRMSLKGGLNDEDTKQEVLSKVEELPLDETLLFVEARETGKTSLKSGGLSCPVAMSTKSMRMSPPVTNVITVGRRAMANSQALT